MSPIAHDQTVFHTESSAILCYREHVVLVRYLLDEGQIIRMNNPLYILIRFSEEIIAFCRYFQLSVIITGRVLHIVVCGKIDIVNGCITVG